MGPLLPRWVYLDVGVDLNVGVGLFVRGFVGGFVGGWTGTGGPLAITSCSEFGRGVARQPSFHRSFLTRLIAWQVGLGDILLRRPLTTQSPFRMTRK